MPGLVPYEICAVIPILQMSKLRLHKHVCSVRVLSVSLTAISQGLEPCPALAYMPSCFSRVWLFVTPWTVSCQAPLSMAFSRQEYWSGLPCPPPGDLPDPGMGLTSLRSPALAGGFFTTSPTWEAQILDLSIWNLFHYFCEVFPCAYRNCFSLFKIIYYILLPDCGIKYLLFSRHCYWVHLWDIIGSIYVLVFFAHILKFPRREW